MDVRVSALDPSQLLITEANCIPISWIAYEIKGFDDAEVTSYIDHEEMLMSKVRIKIKRTKTSMENNFYI